MVRTAAASPWAVMLAWESSTQQRAWKSLASSSPAWLVDGNSSSTVAAPADNGQEMPAARLQVKGGRRGAQGAHVLPADRTSHRGPSQDPADCARPQLITLSARQQQSLRCQHGEGGGTRLWKSVILRRVPTGHGTSTSSCRGCTTSGTVSTATLPLPTLLLCVF